MAEEKQVRQINNPLTLIAVFAGLAEIAATGALPVLTGDVQGIFVWYVMLFPVLLVVSFFVTLNLNHHVLYVPSDFRDERHFMETLMGSYVGGSEDSPDGTEDSEILQSYWQPNGIVNKDNELRLKGWLESNGIDSRSVTFFIRSQQFADARKRAVSDLGLAR